MLHSFMLLVPWGDVGVSVELQHLVQERMHVELQALKIKFWLCFVSILFALAGAGLLWGGMKRWRIRKDRRRRSQRADVSDEDSGQEPSAQRSRAGQYALRSRVRRRACVCGAFVCVSCARLEALICAYR